MKSINKIKRKLRSSNISTLSGLDLLIYFQYRVKNLQIKNYQLVERELEYLLCETGNGKLRFDPLLISILNPKNSTLINNQKYLIEMLEYKKDIQKNINKDLNSVQIQNDFIKYYNKYLTNIKKVSINPFIISGRIENIPVILLTNNGHWILPNNILIDFVNLSINQKKLPIIISKKIHGLLFPIFKELSVIGMNTYTSFVTDERLVEINNFSLKFSNEIKKFKYNEKLDTTSDLINESGISASLINDFFEIHIVPIIEKYYDNFLVNKTTNYTNFEDLINTLRNSILRKRLIKWIEQRKIIQKEVEDIQQLSSINY